MNTLISQLQKLLSSGGVLIGQDVSSRSAGWKGGNTQALAVLRPQTTEQVSAIMDLCHQADQSVVVEGGKTGLVDGAISSASDIVISMERMNAIDSIDAANRTMTVQAGVPLQVIQEQSNAIGLQFPLDLGARGSATIGGNIATNAGGNRVIRYGMTRNLILGLEAVLADGTIISSLNKMLKNNAAYDLKQLFIGTEGTLGIVTRAVLRLSPHLAYENTALLAVNSYSDLIHALHFCDREFSGSLSSFEVMWQSYFHFVTADNEQGLNAPLSRDYPFYILLETQNSHTNSSEHFELTLTNLMTTGTIVDAVIAKSQTERDHLWAVRDNIAALDVLGPVFYFDISLPIEQVEDYLAEAEKALKAVWPDMRHAVFGHLGDGNIHIIASIGTSDPDQRYRFDDILYRCLQHRGGSISAEHGIGTEKKAFLHYSRTPAEIDLMKALKNTLDSKNILNAGKVI